MLQYRQLHPNDIIQVFGVPMQILRVETHYVSVRQANDGLVHYAFDELEPVKISDEVIMNDIGFNNVYIKNGDEKIGITYTFKDKDISIYYFFKEKRGVFFINDPEIGFKGEACENLNDIQQRYYEITGRNLIFNVTID